MMKLVFLLLLTLAVWESHAITEEQYFQELGLDYSSFTEHYQWESPSFKLWVSSDNTKSKVSFILENYVEGFLYQRIFTQTNIRVEIDFRLDVSRVFSAFTSPSQKPQTNYVLGSRIDSG